MTAIAHRPSRGFRDATAGWVLLQYFAFGVLAWGIAMCFLEATRPRRHMAVF